MIDWILHNSMLAGALAILVALLCRLNRTRPALCHLMWLLVFVSLIAPPLPVDFGPGTLLRQRMAGWLSTPAEAAREAPALFVDAMPALPLAGESAAVESPADVTPAQVSSAAPAVARTDGLARSVSSVPVGTWLLLAWGLGSCAVLLRQCRQIRVFQRSLRSSVAAPPWLLRAVDDVAGRLDTHAPDVRMVAGVGSPSVWCFGRARLLWPSDEMGDQQRDDSTLIAHELAHIARNDHWVSRIEALAMVLLWWHPLFWVIRRQVHDTSELSCDAWALWAYPAGRRAYAEALIDAQEKTTTATVALHGLCATGRDIKDFERRLRMIMTHRPMHRVSRMAAATAVFATLLVLPGFTDETSGGDRPDSTDARSRVAGMVDAHKLGAQAEKLFAEGELEAALPVYEQWLALDPDNGFAHSRMGYVLIGMGEYDKAAWHLKMQTAAGYRPEVATYNLACAASLSGDTEGAVKFLRHAVQRGFADTDLLASDADLAAIRTDDRFVAITADVDKVVAVREALFELEDLPEMEGMSSTGKKLKLQRKLASLVAEDGELQNEAGLALLAAGEREAAVEAFERQAAAGYATANAYYNLACAHALMGETESALAALDRSATLGMQHPEIREDADLINLRGDARFVALADTIGAADHRRMELKHAISAGNVEKAVAILDALVADQADEDGARKLASWGHAAVGKAALAKGQSKQALHCFASALEAGSKTGSEAGEVVFQMACAYAQAGDQVAALGSVKDALTLGIADPVAVSELVESAQLGDAALRVELVGLAKTSAEKLAKKSAYDSKAKAKAKAKAYDAETAAAGKAMSKQADALADGSDVR